MRINSIKTVHAANDEILHLHEKISAVAESSYSRVASIHVHVHVCL
jgi:hypothetical protein